MVFHLISLSTCWIWATGVAVMHWVMLSRDVQTGGALKLEAAMGLAYG